MISAAAAITSAAVARAAVAVATDPNIATVKLLMGFEGTNGSTTFTDESASPVTFTTVGSPTITTAQKKMGLSSLAVSASYITTPAGAVKWFPGASDFTYELFVRHTTNGTGLERNYLSFGSNPSMQIYKNSSNGLQGYFRTDAQGAVGCTTANGAFLPTVGQWYHLCLERNGSVLRLYVDGVMVAKSTGLIGTAEGTTAATSALKVGSGSGTGLDGQIDELRMSVGIARYASDAGFVVPTTAYPRS